MQSDVFVVATAACPLCMLDAVEAREDLLRAYMLHTNCKQSSPSHQSAMIPAVSSESPVTDCLQCFSACFATSCCCDQPQQPRKKWAQDEHFSPVRSIQHMNLCFRHHMLRHQQSLTAGKNSRPTRQHPQDLVCLSPGELLCPLVEASKAALRGRACCGKGPLVKPPGGSQTEGHSLSVLLLKCRVKDR